MSQDPDSPTAGAVPASGQVSGRRGLPADHLDHPRDAFGAHSLHGRAERPPSTTPPHRTGHGQIGTRPTPAIPVGGRGVGALQLPVAGAVAGPPPPAADPPWRRPVSPGAQAWAAERASPVMDLPRVMDRPGLKPAGAPAA
ncbi:hypothetical protein CcI49_21225 [Frankia sp. CcI49]|nr:hypothetical protein ACG83_26725 [Frankia sp. R43]ONH58486.1 hypothetical protein CcI49_21225 [Frankia sp. CcI49]